MSNNQKSVIRRHPFVFLFAFLGMLILVLRLKNTPEEPLKPLDYSKPITTTSGAIICPQSVLTDPRASHDTNAIFDVFTAILGRTEKAEALGCQVLRAGIPVSAHPMSSPFDHYIEVSFSDFGSGKFFTMAGSLENSLEVPSAAKREDNIRASYKEMKADFQKKLPTLEAPSESLRWLPLSDDKDLVHILLVTPLGPCSDMVGNPSRRAFSIVTMPGKPEDKSVGSKVLGNYSDQSTAMRAAESYCSNRYTSELSNTMSAVDEADLWFTPEKTTSVVQDQTSSPTETETAPDNTEEAKPDLPDRN